MVQNIWRCSCTGIFALIIVDLIRESSVTVTVVASAGIISTIVTAVTVVISIVTVTTVVGIPLSEFSLSVSVVLSSDQRNLYHNYSHNHHCHRNAGHAFRHGTYVKVFSDHRTAGSEEVRFPQTLTFLHLQGFEFFEGSPSRYES